jgi:hypothetical protein
MFSNTERTHINAGSCCRSWASNEAFYWTIRLCFRRMAGNS